MVATASADEQRERPSTTPSVARGDVELSGHAQRPVSTLDALTALASQTIDKVGQLLWAFFSCQRKSADEIVEP